MPLDLSDFKKYAGLFSRGFVIEMAPEIAKGMLVEFLKSRGVTVKSASDWVQNNVSLWKTFDPSEQEMLKDLAERVGNIDWLDADWVVEALRKDLPTIASLFLGWKRANTWLKRQVEIIRKEVEQ